MNQQHEFEKIHAKLDAMDQKLDNHLERIAKAESEGGWVKLGLLAVIGWISAKFYLFGGK